MNAFWDLKTTKETREMRSFILIEIAVAGNFSPESQLWVWLVDKSSFSVMAEGTCDGTLKCALTISWACPQITLE